MSITLKRLNDAYHMQATNESGEQFEMDGSPAIGGDNLAMRPMQVLLAALGGCSTIDVVSILKKLREPLEDIEVKISGDREAGQVPAVYTSMHLHYILTGNLKPEKVEKAITLSVEKYCSVGMMLEKAAPITWSYEIVGA